MSPTLSSGDLVAFSRGGHSAVHEATVCDTGDGWFTVEWEQDGERCAQVFGASVITTDRGPDVEVRADV